ncbi:MAG: ribonuclease HI family protein [Euryarchaeota archaeon]|nr:ribonuclease HI family protein [Euryarchaeota archaeon]
MRLTIHFDGSANPNAPKVGGVRGIGVVIYDGERVVKEISEKLPGLGSSNSAEYEAIIRGVEEALKMGADEVVVRGDSQLVIRQIEGKYRVLEPKLRPLYEKIANLSYKFKAFQVQWVPREQNKEADRLSNLPFKNAAPAATPPPASKHEALGTSATEHLHDTLCPKCRKPCRLTMEKDSGGRERIRQACAEHGFVMWAPMVEPFVSVARQNRGP